MPRHRKKRSAPPPVEENTEYIGTEVFTSIVCQAKYSHLSPEELRFQDLEIDTGPVIWDPHSFEEARLRYYIDEGRTSVPQFGPPTPASAFSVSSKTNSTFSEAVVAVPDSGSSSLGLGCPAPGPTLDEESSTSICSLCAERLHADSQGFEEYEITSEGSGSDTPIPNLSHPRSQNKRSRISRRVRRLEKTVESLSHGLILALTRGRSTTADGPIIDDSGEVDALTAALSSLFTGGDNSDSSLGVSTPDAALLHPSGQPDSTTERKSTTQLANSKLGALPLSGESKIGPSSVVDHVATGSDCSIFINHDRSPISGLLRPILDFMTCPEVFRFLKCAEAHAGLRGTQLFDLFWVSNSLFNVHGGILIYCLQKSLMSMDAISGVSSSSAWSQDPELMQKLDEIYRKHLRPHIDTDGSRNSVTKVAWESYCFELGGTFSERFPGWESATSFFQNLSEEYGSCLNPIITSSYIEDLSASWTQVHPALLEVTRWFEPFIDYGPDYYRATPLYDATITLGRHARELFSRRGVKESPGLPIMRDKSLMRLLRGHRSGELRKMQREMESVMSGAVSRNFDPAATTAEETPSAEVAALVDRAKQVTYWRVTEPRSAQTQDSLALSEVRVMTSYRPRLLRAGTAAARIRSDVFGVFAQTGRWTDAKGGPIGAREVFWDGIGLPSSL